MNLDDRKRELENKLARRLRGTLTSFIHAWYEQPNSRAALIGEASYRISQILEADHKRTTYLFGNHSPSANNNPVDSDTTFLVGRVVDRLIDRQVEPITKGELIQKVRVWATGAAQRITQRNAERAMNEGVQRLSSGLIFKRWISRMDGRERNAHHNAHLRYAANPIPVNEAFLIGKLKTRMMQPGDARFGAGPADIMNCRCRVEYIDERGRILDPTRFNR